MVPLQCLWHDSVTLISTLLHTYSTSISSHVILTFSLLHPSCCDTMGIYCDMCLPGLVKICSRIVHGKFCRRFFAIHFGVVWLLSLASWRPTLNVLWPCPTGRQLWIFASKLDHSFSKYHVHKFVTDEWTDRQPMYIMPPLTNLGLRHNKSYSSCANVQISLSNSSTNTQRIAIQ